MADNHSFDIVSEVNTAEMHNAVVQAQHEIAVRYDFKGTKAGIEYDKKENKLTLTADNKGQIDTVIQMLKEKMAKRGVAVNALKRGKLEEASHDSVREVDHPPRRDRDRRRQEDRQGHQGARPQGPVADHGQQGPDHGQEEGRASGRDRPPQGARAGVPLAVQQLHLTGKVSGMRVILDRSGSIRAVGNGRVDRFGSGSMI